ncbi:hypothetical protein ARTHRO9AX_70090 [Arthrobacter sp. 9AX]|nr:hypothetical protein ARTHRO9AX_70090 [Arthrobacter sp. 9AX]
MRTQERVSTRIPARTVPGNYQPWASQQCGATALLRQSCSAFHSAPSPHQPAAGTARHRPGIYWFKYSAQTRSLIKKPTILLRNPAVQKEHTYSEEEEIPL